jgi:hypothetical protein
MTLMPSIQPSLRFASANSAPVRNPQGQSLQVAPLQFGTEQAQKGSRNGTLAALVALFFATFLGGLWVYNNKINPPPVLPVPMEKVVKGVGPELASEVVTAFAKDPLGGVNGFMAADGKVYKPNGDTAELLGRIDKTGQAFNSQGQLVAVVMPDGAIKAVVNGQQKHVGYNREGCIQDTGLKMTIRGYVVQDETVPEQDRLNSLQQGAMGYLLYLQ